MIPVDKLSSMSNLMLVTIYRSLNNWQWPKVMGEKPEGWDEMPNYHKPHMSECITKEDIIRPYMQFINEKIPHDQIYNIS